MLPPRRLARLAARLRSAWTSPTAPEPSDSVWSAWDSALESLRLARHRWWLAHRMRLTFAMPGLVRDLHSALSDAVLVLSRLKSNFEEAIQNDEPPSFGSLVAELRQLGEEFDGVDGNEKTGTVSAETESITLNDVELGRFEVTFHSSRVRQHSGSRCFEISALDPNPAKLKSDVIHPHVRDGELCPGDAGRPLENAVSEGRLADAFLLIRSVLNTYNPRSPHVRLEDWNGQPCADCGGSVDPDNMSSCEACYDELCDSCIGSCSACSNYRCSSCLRACSDCESRCCSGCLETYENREYCPECVDTCTGCLARTPTEDLTEDQSLCPACVERREKEETLEEELVESPIPVPAP